MSKIARLSPAAMMSLGPYTLDPSGLADGSFPAGWIAPNWTIATGKGVCSPTLGSELLPDPGLEANYTAGLCDTLHLDGTPTVAESADAHGGSKAQEITADALNEGIIFLQLATPANVWYFLSGWGKRTAGTANMMSMVFSQSGGKPLAAQVPRAWSSASYIQRKVARYTNSTTQIIVNVAQHQGGAAYDTVIVDDFSLKQITPSTMFALRKAKANVTVKAKYTWDRDGICGVVARANAQSNPNTYLFGYYFNYDNSYAYCVLDKCVNGVYSNLIATWSNQATAGAGGIPLATQWLEIRCNGSTVQLFHNNLQVGPDKTVTDVNGSYAGVFQSGGSQLESFFVG